MSFLYPHACLELLELSFQSVLVLLANEFARQIIRFCFSEQREFRTMGKRWPSELV